MKTTYDGAISLSTHSPSGWMAQHFGELRDDLGGWEDLQQGLIRVLHEGSFQDDPTRLYRAVRYEQRYGFRIAEQTLALIPGSRTLISELSAQRIRHELDLVMEEEQAPAILQRLAELDLLKPAHAALIYDEGAARRLARYEPGAALSLPHWPKRDMLWVLWVMVLPESAIESLNRRLHFSSVLLKSALGASALWAEVGDVREAAPSNWVRRLDAAPLMAVYAVYLGLPAGTARSAIGKYLAEWRHVKSKTTGHELERLGVERGPQYQSILRELRNAWLDGKVSSEAEEREYLHGILRRPEFHA